MMCQMCRSEPVEVPSAKMCSRCHRECESFDPLEAVDLLDEHQWAADGSGHEPMCPECGSEPEDGHESGCAIARVLQAAGREVKYENG